MVVKRSWGIMGGGIRERVPLIKKWLGSGWKPTPTVPGAWLSGWSYRSPITIEEQSGSNLENYQVLVELNNTNFNFEDAQSDGEDIRFTLDNRTILIDYWIEEWDNINKSGKLWVEIPSIPASETKVIDMYYGNSSVSLASNANNTFEFFDDFERTEAITFGLINSIEHDHQGLTKIDAAVSDFNEWNPDFVIEIGDILGNHTDFASRAEAIVALDEVEASYANLTMSRKYVFGNHCLDWLFKADYFSRTGMNEKYYSFDVDNYHFIVLDGMFKSNGDDWEDCMQATGERCPSNNTIYVSDVEKTWLENDLSATAKKTFVFMEPHFEGLWAIVNAADVRTILENSGKVIATFAGNRGANGKVTINGIDHYGMKSMDAGSPNAYAKIRVFTDNSIYVEGVGEQTSYRAIPSDKWTVVSGSFSITDDVLTSSGSPALTKIKNSTDIQNMVLHSKLKTASGIYAGLVWGMTADTIYYYIHADDGEVKKQPSGSTLFSYTNVGKTVYHNYEIKQSNGDIEVYIDGDLKGSGTDPNPLGVGNQGVRSYGAVGNWDRVFVRKYVSPEPLISIPSIVTTPTPTPSLPSNMLLTEAGYSVLQEDGSYLLLD